MLSNNGGAAGCDPRSARLPLPFYECILLEILRFLKADKMSPEVLVCILDNLPTSKTSVQPKIWRRTSLSVSERTAALVIKLELVQSEDRQKCQGHLLAYSDHG